jgi:hypothetical protein
MRRQLAGSSAREVLFLGSQSASRRDAAEQAAWQDWIGPRVASRRVLGDGFIATPAWHCVLACHALSRREFAAANVSVVGADQQAIGARFLAAD